MNWEGKNTLEKVNKMNAPNPENCGSSLRVVADSSENLQKNKITNLLHVLICF